MELLPRRPPFLTGAKNPDFLENAPGSRNHCVRGCQHACAPAPHVPPSAPRVGAEGGQGEGEGAPAPHVPPSAPRVGAEGGQGEGEGNRVCSAAQVRNTVPHSIAAERRMRCA